MRLLVHGMQSSGATLFTYFLAQRPGCLALVDILNNYAAPHFESALDAVAKCVVTTAYPIAVHAERFKPDKMILLLRDPRDNYFSLADKNYRNHSGLIDEKFALLDTLFAERHRFDATVHYEDFLERDPAVLGQIRALGWPADQSYFDFARSFEEIIALLWQETPRLLRDEFEISFGNCDPKGLEPGKRRKPRDPAIEAKLDRLCPRLLAHYRIREDAAYSQV
jgi:hypothetical protein